MNQTKLVNEIQRAPSSLKKLPVFGFNKNDFEWPKTSDIGLLFDKPIKLVSFKYRTRGEFIHSIQVTLSNGQSSPMFSASSKDNLSEFKTLQIGDSSHVRKVQGTKRGFNAR